MVLRNLLKWHLVDMTYVSVNKTAGRIGRTGVLKDRSPFEKLPQDVREVQLVFACPLMMHFLGSLEVARIVVVSFPTVLALCAIVGCAVVARFQLKANPSPNPNPQSVHVEANDV